MNLFGECLLEQEKEERTFNGMTNRKTMLETFQACN